MLSPFIVDTRVMHVPTWTGTTEFCEGAHLLRCRLCLWMECLDVTGADLLYVLCLYAMTCLVKGLGSVFGYNVQGIEAAVATPVW